MRQDLHTCLSAHSKRVSKVEKMTCVLWKIYDFTSSLYTYVQVHRGVYPRLCVYRPPCDKEETCHSWRNGSTAVPEDSGGISTSIIASITVLMHTNVYQMRTLGLGGLTAGDWHILLSCYVTQFWLRVKFDKFPSCEYNMWCEDSPKWGLDS